MLAGLMTSRSLVLALATVAMVAISPRVASAADAPYRFEGNGWGHGVGLSQYGAQSRALEGQSAEEIVTAYYTGSSVAVDPSLPLWVTEDPSPLWVGLLEDRSRFDFSADAGVLALCHGLGECPDADLGTPSPGETWSLRSTGVDTCQLYVGDEPVGVEDSCNARIQLGDDSNTRVTLTDTGRTYAHGEIIVRPAGPGEFHVVIKLGIEHYMLGIGEAILSWQPAALQAQALASRTFAVYTALQAGPEDSLPQSVKDDCWCHVKDGTSHQVYKGWEIESYPIYGEYWIDAVQATAGTYITHQNTGFTESSLILALFSSSNGGASETNTAGFGSSTLWPYLDTVSDPYSLVGNPNAPWPGGTHVVDTTIASKLPELTQVDRIRVVRRNPSGSAATVLFEGLNGASITSTERSGIWARWNLGLKSTFISRVCRERGPYDDDGCSFHEHNIFNISGAGFVGTLPGNDYRPIDAMTRSSMAAFLAAGLDLPTASSDYFPDDSNDPNHDAINALAKAGIVVGRGDGTYGPDYPVTRAEMAIYISRALGATLPDSVPDPFPDVPGESWFGPAVSEVLSRGVTNGYGDGTYRPTEPTTREQMAAFLDRAFLGGF